MNRIRRCYYCGKKKYDDKILCEDCEKALNERLDKKKKSHWIVDKVTYMGKETWQATCICSNCRSIEQRLTMDAKRIQLSNRCFNCKAEMEGEIEWS